jgi:hypothetical protein
MGNCVLSIRAPQFTFSTWIRPPGCTRDLNVTFDAFAWNWGRWRCPIFETEFFSIGPLTFCWDDE